MEPIAVNHKRVESIRGIITLTKRPQKVDSGRQADASEGGIQTFGDRGVWVPLGMTAAMVMAGAAVLLKRTDELGPYSARIVACDVWEAMNAARLREACDRAESPMQFAEK